MGPTLSADAAERSGLPEGALLLFSGDVNGAVLLVHGLRDPIPLAEGFVGYDISPADRVRLLISTK